MQLSITGKNLEINENLRKYVEKKIGRLDRFLPNIIDGRVELAVAEGARAAEDRQIAQVTLRTKHAILRAEEASADIFASVDAVFEKMQRQIDRHKRRRRARRGEGGEIEALPAEEMLEEEAPEERKGVTRVKRFQMIPMDEEEAIEQMELLGHDFYVFYNINQNQINVLYRRRSGDYGLIQPELA
ncbi:MAG: ribosome hibernation-promoting factor, HPF/YfiA family [Anaerolineae bacterium]